MKHKKNGKIADENYEIQNNEYLKNGFIEPLNGINGQKYMNGHHKLNDVVSKIEIFKNSSTISSNLQNFDRRKNQYISLSDTLIF